MARDRCCLFLLTWLLFLGGAFSSSDCDCSSDLEDRNRASALQLKFVAIASILVAGGLGVLIPILGRWVSALRPDKDIFYVIKAFAAGVIVATGMIHILPDAFDSLTSPCLPGRPWGDFPFAGFVSMVSALATLMVDTLATSYYKRSHFSKARPVDEEGGDDPELMKTGDAHANHVHVHTHATHGHTHGSAPLSDDEESLADRIRHRVVSQVLELGIAVHSVVIGISLGASDSPRTIRPLVGALSFHQFFEGMGLGGCIVQARFKAKVVVIMALFFSLTTPIGIVVGVGISSVYRENNSKALIVEGIFNAASAGILIYMALVDLLASDFSSSKMQTSCKLQLWSYLALFLGVGLMSLIAKWA